MLKQQYHKTKIIDDSDDIGKLIEIVQASPFLKSFKIREELTLGKRKIPEHLVIQNEHRVKVLGF
ncbi:MAG: hypothetical protein AB4426_04220 [Xenococcaceae cyanobacterium]